VYPARGGFENAQDHGDGGGFSRTVRTEQPYDFVARYMEGNTVNGQSVVIALRELGDRENVGQV
jgi:hypothetical protein